MDYSKEAIISNVQPVNIIRGIYFLIKNNEIVYVGQSENVMHRIYVHSKDPDKDFDGYSIIELNYLSQTELNNTEAFCIIKFRPIYNSSVPTNEFFKSLATVKNLLNVDAWTIKRWIARQKVTSYNGYYDIRDFSGFSNE